MISWASTVLGLLLLGPVAVADELNPKVSAAEVPGALDADEDEEDEDDLSVDPVPSEMANEESGAIIDVTDMVPVDPERARSAPEPKSALLQASGLKKMLPSTGLQADTLPARDTDVRPEAQKSPLAEPKVLAASFATKHQYVEFAAQFAEPASSPADNSDKSLTPMCKDAEMSDPKTPKERRKECEAITRAHEEKTKEKWNIFGQYFSITELLLIVVMPGITMLCLCCCAFGIIYQTAQRGTKEGVEWEQYYASQDPGAMAT